MCSLTGMMPDASPTKRYKFRCFEAEFGALQKNLQSRQSPCRRCDRITVPAGACRHTRLRVRIRRTKQDSVKLMAKYTRKAKPKSTNTSVT